MSALKVVPMKNVRLGIIKDKGMDKKDYTDDYKENFDLT